MLTKFMTFFEIKSLMVFGNFLECGTHISSSKDYKYCKIEPNFSEQFPNENPYISVL